MAFIPSDLSVTKKHFTEDICRNCNATLQGKFCTHCGQKKVARIGAKYVSMEIWEMVRWFEMEILEAAFRLLTNPGHVAREYVLGMRKKHQHPLKLLLIAVGILIYLINQTHYLTSADANTSKAIEVVKEYGKWSFSLGIIAILGSSNMVFWRRLRYNFTEHMVLAIYCHFIIISLNIINLIPNLFIHSTEWLNLHKQYSRLYMDVVDVVVLFVAFKQFFFIRIWQEWWKLLIALVVYVVLKWSFIYLYAWVLVKLVLAGVI